MGFTIAGAVEVRGSHPEGMKQYWQRFATLETVYLRSRMIYDELFGVYADDGGTKTPMFADRGLPDDLSDAAFDDQKTWAKTQKYNRTHHDSWFTWDEMESSHWLDEWDNGVDTGYRTALSEYNWSVFFHVVRELSLFYGSENVRVVVWFVC